MDSEAILTAVGKILRERFAQYEAALAATKLASITSPEPGVAVLEFGDGSTQRLTLPGARGEPGEPGTRGERGERGERGTPGTNGAPGTPGERGEPGSAGVGVDGVEQDDDEAAAFTLRFTNGERVEVQLPRGQRGERGDTGEPGRDRFIASPRILEDGERVEKNDLVAWGGGIMQALRATSKTPGDEPASYVCVVAGVASLALVENIETRTYDLTATLSNGLEHVCRLRAMPRLLGDGPRPGERIIRGDQFVKGDWLYTATQDGADATTTDAGGWRRQYLRGKRGDDGKPGDNGRAGVGIADVTLDDAGILTVRLTTGEEKVFDVTATRAAA